MNTLYRYTFDEETGNISCEKITDCTFKEVPANTYNAHIRDSKDYYRVKIKGNIQYAYVKDFDRLKNNRVYSFNFNQDDIKRIIWNALEEKRKKAEQELDRWTKAIERLK